MNIIHLEEVDSTMTYAETNFSECQNLQCVYADRQTGGYGRHDRTWFSPKGNIYMTISVPKDDQPLPTINIITPLSIIRVLTALGLTAKLKWPNDIIVDNHKVCGILTKVKGNTVHVGIGLNVNCTDFSHIKRLIFPCASLKQITGTTYDIDALVQKIVDEFKQLWNDSCRLSYLDEYRTNLITDNLLFKVGNGEPIHGSICHVDIDGIVLNDGTKLCSGDVIQIHQ